MGDFDACRFDFRLDAKNGLMPSKRRKTERIQPSNYSTLFKCKICGTLFTCRMLLLEHKLTHSEYRYNRCKYECGLCSDKRFSRKDHLRDHLTREHQLDGAKVAEVMGEGRLKQQQHAVARKSRGSALNRKSPADGSIRRPVVKRTSKNSSAKEEDDDDVRDASQVAAGDVITTAKCTSALGASFQANSATSASPQTQTTTFGDKILPPNYLYINFPILITPTTTTTTATTSKSNDSTTTRLLHHHNHHHSMIQGDPNWSTPPSLPVDLAQRIKVELDNQLTSQSSPAVTSSQPGNMFDLPMALSRFLAYNNYVTSRRDDVDDRKYGVPATSGDVTPFDLFASTVKRDLGHLKEGHRGHSIESGTLVDLGNDLGEGGLSEEEETALDFSLKTSGHLAYQGNTYENSSLNRHNDAESQSDLDDVVDLSRKKWLSSITAQNPDRDADRRKYDGNRMGKWSAPWNISNLPSSSKVILPSPADATKPSVSIGSTGSKASQVVGQGSASSRGKSVLNRTVEKLWKNKIGRISNLAEAERESDSLDFVARGNNREARNSPGMKSDENNMSARPWNLSAESPTKTERFRNLDVAPVICDKDDYDNQSCHQQHKREIYTCISAADEEKDELITEEDSIVDLTTSVSGRNCTAAEPDGIVSPSSSEEEEEKNLSSKDLVSVRLPYGLSDLDTLPFSQSEQLFNQLMRDLELTAILKGSSDGSPVENNNPNPSVPWTSNSKVSEDVQELEDAASMPEGHRPGSNSITPISTARQRKPDHRLNCGYPECGRTFKEWRHLKVHLTLHTGEKPLSCYLCKYTCRHRSSMNWHMRSKHRMEKSKAHGNRTVYVDSTEAETELVCDDDDDDDDGKPEPETGISQFPETNRENCDDFTAASAEEEEEEKEKESVFLNTLRNNLSILSNGLTSKDLHQNVLRTGRGRDVTLTDSSTGETEDARLKEDDSDGALVVDDKQDNTETGSVTKNIKKYVKVWRSAPGFWRGAPEAVPEESLPQLLLKKVTASPGKDPKFYTSLMRLRYVKHPSTKFHGHRQPQKRRPSAVKRNEVARDVTEAKRDRLREETAAPSIVCVRCGFAADSETELQSHVLATHGKEIHELRDNPCSTCGKSNSRISHHHHHHHQQQHNLLLLSQKKDSAAKCACPVANCNQQFADNGTLRHHLRLLHAGELTKSSMNAAETGVSLQDAEQPRSSTPSSPPPPVGGVSTPLPVQTDERPVACDYPGCDKSFRELKHLKVHHMQHTDEKPLRCHICDYSCRQRNSLNWHMKSKHGLEKHVTNDGRTVYI